MISFVRTFGFIAQDYDVILHVMYFRTFVVIFSIMSPMKLVYNLFS